jgi:hypothetical protein
MLDTLTDGRFGVAPGRACTRRNLLGSASMTAFGEAVIPAIPPLLDPGRQAWADGAPAGISASTN